MDAGVGFAFVLLHKKSVLPPIDLPIDLSNVVARPVLPVFRKINTKSQMRRSMQPADKSVDNGARNQFQARDPAEHQRINESSSLRCGSGGHNTTSFSLFVNRQFFTVRTSVQEPIPQGA